jgi:WhiB family redox-sensing transcriptional regulator
MSAYCPIWREDRPVTGAEFAFHYSLMVTTGADLPDLTEVFERPAWQQNAACRGADVSIFFPVLGESTAPAKALCGTCPVAEPCRAYAVDNPGTHGVWGGTSQGQRSVLRNGVSGGERRRADSGPDGLASARPLHPPRLGELIDE